MSANGIKANGKKVGPDQKRTRPSASLSEDPNPTPSGWPELSPEGKAKLALAIAGLDGSSYFNDDSSSYDDEEYDDEDTEYGPSTGPAIAVNPRLAHFFEPAMEQRRHAAVKAMLRRIPAARPTDDDGAQRFAGVCEDAIAFDLDDESAIYAIEVYRRTFPLGHDVTDADICEELRKAEKATYRGSSVLPAGLLVDVGPEDSRHQRLVTVRIGKHFKQGRFDVFSPKPADYFCFDVQTSFGLNLGASKMLADMIREQVEDHDEKPDLSSALPISQFVQRDYKVEYLIPYVMVAGQPGVISARSKSLKTSIALDAHVSMATATRFLGYWEVPEPVRSGILTAESGEATIKETLLRIARGRGLDAAQSGMMDNCIVETKSPQLRQRIWLDEIKRFIETYGLRCLTIDPTYLALAGIDQNSLAAMAEALAPLNRIISTTGCSINMVHHNRKVTENRYGCPTLDEITGSGFAQWARYWILLCKRREWNADTGEHDLWLVTGGSAGFGSTKWVHVREGQPKDPGGRIWQVTVESAAEGERKEKASREQQRAQGKAEQREADKGALKRALSSCKDGVGTKTDLKGRTGISSERIVAAIADLLNSGQIVMTEITKGNNRPYEAYTFPMED